MPRRFWTLLNLSARHDSWLKTTAKFRTRSASTVGRHSHSVAGGKAETVSTPAPLRLMPLGGSVTWGYGSSDGNGYRGFLLEILRASGHQVTMVGSRRSGSMENNENEGWRGFRIDEIHNKARRSLPLLRPDLVLVNAGSNDCLQGFELERIGSRMGDLLDCIWLASPRSTIILSSLLRNLDAQTEARVLLANEQFRTLARQQAAAGGKRIVFADMHGPDGQRDEELLADGTHPDDRGYYRMAGIWFRGIQEAVARGFIAAPGGECPQLGK